MRLGALVLILTLVASLAQAAPWTQQGGDMQRSSVAALGGVTLDVVRRVDLVEPAWRIAAIGPSGLVETPHGLTYAAYDGDAKACTIVWLDVETWTPRQTVEVDCASDRNAGCDAEMLCDHRLAVLGHDPSHDLLLGWVESGVPLRAWDAATGEEAWRAGPARAASDAELSWTCATAAIDSARGEVVAGCYASTGNEGSVVALSIEDGRVLWSASLPAATYAPPAPFLSDTPPIAETGGGAPEFLTLAAEAVLVRGIGVATASVNEMLPRSVIDRASDPAVAWFSREGELVGHLPLPRDEEARIDTSQWAAVNGDQGVLLFAGKLYVLNLLNEDFTALEMPSGLTASREAAPPAWAPPTLMVPTYGAVTRFDSNTFEPSWTWRAPQGAFVYHVLLAPPGDVYVLEAAEGIGATSSILHRLDVSTGRELQRLELRDLAEQVTQGSFTLQLLPVARTGELLAWSDHGPAYVLGLASDDARPAVEVSTAYPPPFAPFALRASTSEGSRLLVAWGDGAVEEMAPGAEMTHQYDERRPYVIRVTAVAPDNTTATREVLMRVGEEDPAAKTALEKAFGPELQNYTLFALGLVATGGGALVAALLARRRHSRLRHEEKLLRKVVDASLVDPTPGLVALDAHRQRLRDLHVRHKLDDAQFALLDQRAVRAMRSARYRLIGPALNKVTPHTRSLMDTAFEDGEVTTGEMLALGAALEHETALTDAERAHVRGLFERWSR